MEWLFWILLFIVFYTYIGYGLLMWLLVILKEHFKKRNTHFDEQALPEVTLLIAAYNEEDVVAEKMRNCHTLRYPKDKLKLVWVTDGSTDLTTSYLSRYEDVIVLYDSPRKGKTAALNRAIDYIETPIVVFTDANTMLNSDAIYEIAVLFLDPQVGCVSGEKRIHVDEKADSASAGEGFYWKYESFLKDLDWRFYSVVGAAGELFAVRRSLFVKMDEDTLLDDFILSLRIAEKGYRIAYTSKAYAVERGSADMQEEEKRKIRIAAGGLQSVWRLRSLLNPFKYGRLTFQYISHRVLRWTITPLALFSLLPINIFLVVATHGALVYVVMLVLQLLFYISGYLGYRLSLKKIKNKVLYIPYYFLFMNLNVFKGIRYLVKRKGSGAWEKAKRSV